MRMKLRGLPLVAMAFVVFGTASVGSPAFAQSDWLQELEADCNAGKGDDCAMLGSQLRGGYITPRDPVRARAAFEKGCELDSTNACAELYKALALGEGGPKDTARAEALADKACNTGIVSLTVYLKSNGLCTE